MKRLADARSLLAAAALAATVLLLVATAARNYRHVWDRLGSDRQTYSRFSPKPRATAFGDAVPLPMNVFDFYRLWLRPGDRYYLDVLPSGFGEFADLPATVRAVGRFYLLPAVLVDRPDRADVILFWKTFPQRLRLTYASIHELGAQDFFVARLQR